MTQARKIAVVGGGLAGITAALACADAGAEVTLLEERAWLGGATFSIEKEGLWLDNGQHVFLRCCTAYLGLLERLGVARDVHLQRRLALPVLLPGQRASWLKRSALPAPLHLGSSLLRFSPLTLRDRLRIGRAVLALRRLHLDDPALDRETFAAWLGRHGQSAAAVSALWDLITLPTVNLRADEASLALAAKVFKTGLLEDAAAADVGWAAVPLQRLHGEAGARALADAGVLLRLRVKVRELDPAGTVRWDGGSLEADAVVLAVPHDDAARLLPAGALPADVDPAALGVSPILNLHVGYDRRVTELDFAAGVGTPVQFVFDRTVSSGFAGGQMLAVSISGADEYADWPVDRLRERFLAALGDLFPAARGAEVTHFFVTREPRATFRGGPGSARHRPGPVTGLPGILLAGAWTDTGWPATMESAVLSGQAAARAALASANG
ncbi:MAG: hydroxysqualene dehydroxylase HpnE [Gaiella sp.]